MAEFILNGWYCAAWSTELSDALLTRRLLDMPVMLYRKEDGTAAAMLDRCPHRFAPLSRGTREGDEFICGYHGLRYDSSGQCIGSPFNRKIPPGIQVQIFPVQERWGVIWFWPGDPQLADARTIPDFSCLETQPGPHGYLYLRANYLLSIDNLMDLSHIEFVHLRTFGGAGAFMSGEHSAERISDTEIWSRWWMPDVLPPAPAKQAFGDMRVNHWQDMRWTAPAACLHDLGIIPADQPRPTTPGSFQSAHLLTPETSRSTHYFYSRESEASDGSGEDLLTIAFEEEDGPMLEAVQANMAGDFWNERPISLKTDSAGLMVRRTIEAIIREEASDAVHSAQA